MPERQRVHCLRGCRIDHTPDDGPKRNDRQLSCSGLRMPDGFHEVLPVHSLLTVKESQRHPPRLMSLARAHFADTARVAGGIDGPMAVDDH